MCPARFPSTLSRPVVIPASLPIATEFDVASIRAHDRENTFIDAHGRTLLFRGLNVSGDAKYPINNPLAGTDGFYDVSNISYTGRPFANVQEATEWWRRLKNWGVGIVRMVICWEALEPREMGQYDEEYVAYLHEILQKASEAGLLVFIDGHQDTWSRFTGGSGAPLWTFDLVGLDATKFRTTCSAALDSPEESSSHSTPSGRLWPTNYSKFGPATMFTLFFAGEVFAPKAIYDNPKYPEFHGKNVGYVLRTAHSRAYSHLAERLKDLANILGFDPMNEPHPGYIGCPSLHYFNENTDLHLGYMPNALQSMALAAGIPTSVPYFSRSWPHPSRRTRNDLLNATRTPAWLPRRKDIWLEEGVFVFQDDDKVALGPQGESYFTKNPVTGEKIDFENDFYVPFLKSFRKAITEAVKGGNAGTWTFVEPVPNLGPPVWEEEEKEVADERICYSPHWYDIRVLYEKGLSYNVSFDVLSLAGGSRNFFKHTYLGRNGLTLNYSTNFSRFVKHLDTFRPSSKPSPILIGETGIPFDINLQSLYNTGDIHTQLVQLDAVLHGMERSNLNWTLWNISLSNSTLGKPESCHNETASAFQSGDGWNSEDFSIVSTVDNTVEVPLNASARNRSEEQQPHDTGYPLTRGALFGELYKGGRVLPALVRPYPGMTAGILKRAEFIMTDLRFEMEYVASYSEDNATEASRTTVLFVPSYHFSGRRVLLHILLSPSSQPGPFPGLQQSEVAITSPAACSTAPAGGAVGVSWLWNEYDQSLTLIHQPWVGGRLIHVTFFVVIEEGPKGLQDGVKGFLGWFI
ncbi:hypothetical protein RUND412_006461 [Rhizina undulata]